MSSKSFDKRWRGALLAFTMVLAIVVELPAMLSVRVVEYDEAVFLNVARNIQRTGVLIRSIGAQGVFYFIHTPLYPYLLGLCVPQSAGVVLHSRLTTTVIGLGCVLLVFYIGEQIKDTIAGLVAALLLAVNSFFALYSFFITMEVPMVFSMLWGLLLVVKGVQGGSDRMLGMAGLALAVAALFKEIALLFTPVCAVYVLINRWRNRQPAWKAAILVMAPTMIGMIAWAVWCWRISPSVFSSAIRRWVGSIAVSSVSDPRMRISVGQWGLQIVSDLFGVGVALGLVAIVVLLIIRKGRVSVPVHYLLLGYLALAIGVSFVMRLKEPRHLIGGIPVAALLIGTSVDWRAVLAWGRSHWLRGSVVALGIVLVLFSASPMRLPLDNVTHLNAWFDSLYAHRVFDSDAYYNVLRLAGLYIQDHSEPDEVITVAHEGTVVGYYADRHYNMLYTLPDEEKAIQTLERTRYLVWDHAVFLALSDEQIQAVQDYVVQHFDIEEIVQDDYRQVTIYVKRGAR